MRNLVLKSKKSRNVTARLAGLAEIETNSMGRENTRKTKRGAARNPDGGKLYLVRASQFSIKSAIEKTRNIYLHYKYYFVYRRTILFLPAPPLKKFSGK